MLQTKDVLRRPSYAELAQELCSASGVAALRLTSDIPRGPFFPKAFVGFVPLVSWFFIGNPFWYLITFFLRVFCMFLSLCLLKTLWLFVFFSVLVPPPHRKKTKKTIQPVFFSRFERLLKRSGTTKERRTAKSEEIRSDLLGL